MKYGFVKNMSFVLLLATLAAGLSSCGRRGALQSPTAASVTETGEVQPEEIKQPERDFILDGLI